MPSASDPGRDPTLDGRRSLNDFRYAYFFWALLVLAGCGVVSTVVRADLLGILGALFLGGVALIAIG